jgi:uncharacterized membrane protein
MEPDRDKRDELAALVHRNIRALLEVRRSQERNRTRAERFADAVTRFAGSMWSILFHALFFAGWILWNSGALGLLPFDRPPFVMLAMIATLEAIFLTTFVLISQNRMNELADRRADLDLQINLLSEHEITHVLHMLEVIAARLGIDTGRVEQLEELKRDVQPERVLEEIERAAVEEHAPPE